MSRFHIARIEDRQADAVPSRDDDFSSVAAGRINNFWQASLINPVDLSAFKDLAKSES